jgi:flavin reductase (DIM6/NTAB) family NADH-FMN oxidoreductase RutF
MTLPPQATTEQHHETIGAVLGRTPSGVYIVTARNEAGERFGMLASWVIQNGFEPPSVSMAVHPDRAIAAVIEATGRFTVNILARENTALMKPFSHPSPESFNGLPIEDTAYGVSLTNTIGALCCQLTSTVQASDHILMIGRIETATLFHPELEPFVHIRKNGFNY